MGKRKPLSKKIRFEVFKRDAFKCAYCGRSAPNVILECDHIIPVAEGGTNDIINLITSCHDCNSGKGKTQLADTTAIDRQRKQLEDINEMREQAEMLIAWKQELMEAEEKQVDEIAKIVEDGPYKVSEHGRRSIKRLIHRFSFSEVYDAAVIAIDRYYDGSRESLELALNKIGGVCYNIRYRYGG